MIRLLLLSLLVLLPILCIGKVVIRGKIHNYDGKTRIGYYRTLQGVMTAFWEEHQPNPNGTSTIKFENEGLGTTVIVFQKIRFRLLHDEDSEIFLEIDQESLNLPPELEKNRDPFYLPDSIRQNGILAIKGHFNKVNWYYNHIPRTAFISPRAGNRISTLISYTEEPKRVHRMLDSLINKEIDMIKGLHLSILPENKDKDLKMAEIRSFLINEVKAFYGAVFLMGMEMKRWRQVREIEKDPMTEVEVYNITWEKEVENYLNEVRSLILPLLTAGIISNYRNVLKSRPPTISVTFEKSPNIQMNILENTYLQIPCS